MKLFQSARMQLTAWYLLIIMCITILFSMVLYRALTYELDRFQQRQMMQLENPASSYLLSPQEFQMRQEYMEWSIQAVIDAKQRTFWLLAGINGGILLISGGLGYVLAGRTLKPIKVMVEEQQRFISDASHELRTPLTALKSEIEVGLRDKTMSTKDARELLQSNLEEVNNLTRLSNNLLELTYQQSATSLTRGSSIEIETLIQDVVKRVQGLAKKKKISLSVGSLDGRIQGNAEQLSEVIMILLDNAIKYSEANTTISIASAIVGHQVKLTVADQGIGISSEDLHHIFERFYRSDSARNKTKTTGYGLGLSIAKKIIEEHKGKIQVTSSVSQGTQFTIFLPLA